MVTKVLKRGSYWADGPEIKEFENMIANYLNVNHVISFNSGTSALHALLLASGITEGEVIVPSMSFISTANCVVLAGAKPVFAEIESDTLGLTPEDVKEKITKKTKAIIPVHYGGKVCKNIKILKEIADDNNIVLIEDNAESFGAKKRDKFAGTFGQGCILSFCQNKVIPTGEGGAVCCEEEEVYKKLLLIRSHGRVEKPGVSYFSTIKASDYIEIGYNYRIPTMCAALGISQLEKIEKIIELRRKVGKYYDEHLKKIPEIQILPEIEGNNDVYQLYTMKLKNPAKRDALQDFLAENKIYTKIYFTPIHLKTFYKKYYGYSEGSLPRTEAISKKLLSLPFSLHFSNEDQNNIINKIRDFFS